MEILKYSIQNLLARKSRSMLTILSIMIGIATIFIFASFGWGLQKYVKDIGEESGLDKFMLQAKGGSAPGMDDTFKLEDSDLDEVLRTRGVSEATGMYFAAAQVEKDRVNKFVWLVGHSANPKDIKLVEELFTFGVETGRQLQNGDDGRVVLGHNYRVPDKIFNKPYGVGDNIKINGKKFSIIGFYEKVGNPSDDANIYMIEDTYKDLIANATFAMVFGRVTDYNDMDNTIDRIEKNVRKERGLEEGKEDFFVQSYEDALEMFTNVLAIVIGFVFLIVIISAVVASVNTANTMITSVLERVQEIGVMKSIGARNSKIRDIFLIESSILGLLAGVSGVVVGWIISFAGGQMLDALSWGFLAPYYNWTLFVGCIGLATLVGTVSGVAPAIYASKQNAVDALRYE